ncbi:endonuclease III domain-containing protein [Frigoriglobus tundricola]|uniref:Endonuclease III n=1 Tax=Frigoriglobus tundricola TaxID=2774151 RepID=A0A6M5YZL4_9BACT|nr:endonuclease III [Frigoriglobus tundricola]QJW98896.1 Endonuclease III [Frigoriglobus tundricola]
MSTPKRPKKQPFDIEKAMPLLREAVAPYPKAALFELYAEGHTSVFEILIACIISIRTHDEVTLPAARRLFAAARTPAAVADLSVKQIDPLISPCTFHDVKAKTIRDIAIGARDEHGGTLPCDPETLMAFKGVGPKCAHLALGIACDMMLTGVDIHVHRVTNRWGYVAAKTPEKTMEQLHEKLPRHFRVEINALLVPFGKHICTGERPKCSTCPLIGMCRQVGVLAPQ